MSQDQQLRKSIKTGVISVRENLKDISQSDLLQLSENKKVDKKILEYCSGIYKMLYIIETEASIRKLRNLETLKEYLRGLILESNYLKDKAQSKFSSVNESDFTSYYEMKNYLKLSKEVLYWVRENDGTFLNFFKIIEREFEFKRAPLILILILFIIVQVIIFLIPVFKD